MQIGPYITKDNKIVYVGNKLFKKIEDVKGVLAPDMSGRATECRMDDGRYSALMRIYNGLFSASKEFMDSLGAMLFDLPITTRMISSPGALKNTIISDVDPFKIDFFDHKTFLTQSSQLYLEFAITTPEVDQVWCWDKSFRMERADFRHLPEFTHIEFEGNNDFEKNLNIQENYLVFIINYLIDKHYDDLSVYLNDENIEFLKKAFIKTKFEKIRFYDAFKLLKKITGEKKYDEISIAKFGAYEEILLTREFGNVPFFVTHYISNEVAFYHADDKKQPHLAVNADLMFPGFGELIGSGERVGSRDEALAKARRFKLDMDDYESYINSRQGEYKVHSGWGMGVERFLQCILGLPFIWNAKVFPRVDNSVRP